jgi:CRP-like cAMP-binding protein
MSSLGWLRGFRAASALTDADIDLLERILVVSTHPQGHTFFREGERADGVTAAMYFVLEGSVGVSAKAPAGGFGVQATLGPGDVFGTVALVADVPRTATCQAVTQVKAAKLDRRTFEELFRRNVGLHARFQLVIARTLASDLRRLRALLVKSLATGDEAPLRNEFGGT